MHGFYRVSSAVPLVKPGDIKYNTEQIIHLIGKADKLSVALVVFPELSITGYTCADLFMQTTLIDASYDAIEKIRISTSKMSIISVIGSPVYFNAALYNTAIIIHHGKILAVIPKVFNPNYKEFYEKRWFKSGMKFNSESLIDINGQMAPFTTNILCKYNDEFSFAVEICEDLWSVIPPSSYHALAGASVILNLSASNELVAKASYRRDLVKNQSARCICAYIYSSSGVGESSTDLLFGGHSIISENGIILNENKRFQREAELLIADIDCQRLKMIRMSESSFSDTHTEEKPYKNIQIDNINNILNLDRSINPHPFVPVNINSRDENCEEIFNIQSSALAKRFEHTNSSTAIIGISGGLDSTLALLVIKKSFALINKKNIDIIAITMPGFGTSKRTYTNAIKLCKELDIRFKEIDIKEACLKQFEDIGHDENIHDVTYENVQARMRTQILMNLANKEKGLVIGTGDLSEMAMGWSTYNGDHMSMYAVNCGVPKTLVRYLVQWVADSSTKNIQNILLDIINTPVSPELLPKSENGEINQKTEELIGPYELHDFFLYHTLKYGASPEKIKYLANIAFTNKYKKQEITKWYSLFIKRFFSQQFKRSCIPDGPKVGTISLSPRGDWRMPSDASPSAWL